MRIAVIGKGRVGGALGFGWAGAGHQVTFGVRDPPNDPALSHSLNEKKAKTVSVRGALFTHVSHGALPQ